MPKGPEKMTNKFELVDRFPELVKLKGVVENNAWHDYDDVLKHTEVMKNVKSIIQRDNLEVYFNQPVGGEFTRGETLVMAAAFHDIAKPETIEINGTVTSCPNHELIGAGQTEEILKSKFDNNVVNRVVSIIQNHGVPIGIFSPEKSEDQFKQELYKLKQEKGDIFVDLMVLVIADTKSSQLNKKNPEEFNFRISLGNKVLNELSLEN